MPPRDYDLPYDMFEHHIGIAFRLKQSARYHAPAQYVLTETFAQELSKCTPTPPIIRLAKATPALHATQGCIRIIAAGLETGHIITDTGNVLYFARERVNAHNIYQWESFCVAHKRCQKQLMAMMIDYMDSHGCEGLYDKYENRGYFRNTDKQQILTSIIRHHHLNENKAFSLHESLETLSQGMDVFDVALKPYEEKYVLYASNRPITAHLFQEQDGRQELISFKSYQERYGHLLAIMTATKSLQCSEHRGIFKTPFACLSSLKAQLKSQGIYCGGLSTALQCFAMKCAKRSGAEFMTVSPVPAMHDIFKSTLQACSHNELIQDGVAAILEAGWQSQIRAVAAHEKPIVCHIKRMNIPLW